LQTNHYQLWKKKYQRQHHTLTCTKQRQLTLYCKSTVCQTILLHSQLINTCNKNQKKKSLTKAHQLETLTIYSKVKTPRVLVANHLFFLGSTRNDMLFDQNIIIISCIVLIPLPSLFFRKFCFCRNFPYSQLKI
jgi:hypothetical protein